MKLSVIIVNYNVEFFLEQCLLSVESAIKGVDAEVYVVDNKSVDGSVAMVRDKFPWVKLIENKDNVGFSIANNQAIEVSQGEYVLLLNPDTVLEEKTLQDVCSFMDQTPDAGGLGVRMVDGKGHFLPESKRGLPTPKAALYKISGLYRLFPRSGKINRYYMGNLSEHETNEVEILSGAFMLLRKEALDKTGLLDESFFMYGEDIDLSWRLVQAGYKNYYFPKTTIIHYKGESTKKGSLNYVFVFYNAMIIFAKKHFSEKNARLFSQLINAAIYMRAALAIISRFVRKSIVPLVDFGVILVSLVLISRNYAVWQNKVFDPELLKIAFPIYSIVWLVSVYLTGGYDKPLKLLNILKGMVIGTGVILIGYSLLPEDLRFSRALILLGGINGFILLFFVRLVLHRLKVKGFSITAPKETRQAVVGSSDETSRVRSLLEQANANPGFYGIVSPPGHEVPGSIGTVKQLADIVRVHKIDEVIFCAKDLTSAQIISTMSSLTQPQIEFKIVPPESMYIIGSNSIQSSSNLLLMDVNSVSKPKNKRNKRLLDVLLSLFFFISLPVTLLIVRQPAGFVKNILNVLVGKKSWVGFSHQPASKLRLPRLKTGVLSPSLVVSSENPVAEVSQKLNLVYAKDYRIMNDLIIVNKCFRSLGRQA
jgi:GT2 family glycosyltransferase